MADLEDVTLDGRPLQSLRVADLKAALEERGLSKSGQKNTLIKRLKGALMLENLHRTSTAHVGLQPNSQIGEEMSQNSFIKQYLAKQQELLRQRLERESCEVYDTNEQEAHREVNNSTSCPPQVQDVAPALDEQHKPPGPSAEGFSGANEREANQNRDADVPSPASGSVATSVPGGEQWPERHPSSNEVGADSDDEDSDEGEEDGEDDDWNSGGGRRSLRQPTRGPLTRERSGASYQPQQQQQHMPSLLSPQLRQPTPPPSPPPEFNFPLPDTPKQSPPSPEVAPPRRSPSSSSSGSSSSDSRSSSPEPQSGSGSVERKPGPLTLLARKMASEGAFSGVGWHSGEGNGDRQDTSSVAASSFPGRGPPEGLVSAITHTANTSGPVSFPMFPATSQGDGVQSTHIQVPVSVLKATATEERNRRGCSETEHTERQERQRIAEQEQAMEEEGERNLALLRAEKERALERERIEKQQALEKEEQERALQLERELALDRERQEKELALVKEREEQELALAREKALELERQRELERQEVERQKELERQRELERQEVERQKELERQRELERQEVERQKELERQRELERQEVERQKVLEQERIQREKEREKQEREEMERALQQERERALEQERLERERIMEAARIERQMALEQERIEKEKALEEKRLEMERIENEKAQERLERERASEQERIAMEEKEKAAAEKKLEQERALEEERKEAERECDRVEKDKAMQEQARALEMADKEREIHLPQSKRKCEVGLTPLPTPPSLSTGPGRKSPTDAGEQEDVSSSRKDASGAPTSPSASPQSAFKKFRFLRESHIPPQSSSPSVVIKRPRKFSDAPLSSAASPDVAQQQQEGLGPDDKKQEEPVKVEEAATEKREAEESQELSSAAETAQRRGRDANKEEKQARKRSSSRDSSSSESDSGSSSSGSSSSSTSSQDKSSSSSRSRRDGRNERGPSPHRRKRLGSQLQELQNESQKAPPRKSELSAARSDTTPDDSCAKAQKRLIDEPREEMQKKRKVSEAEEEKDEQRQLKEAVMAESEKTSESCEETPKAFSARKISLGSSKSSPGTGSTEGEQDCGAAAGRKRRWGSSTTVTAKKPSISITTDSLKSLIPDIRPSLGQEAVVDLHPEEAVLSGAEDEEQEHSDPDLQIRRTVTQVVHSESQENGQKEAKRSKYEDEEELQADEVSKEQEEKMDTSSPGATETKFPPDTSREINTGSESQVAPSDTLVRRSISQQRTGVSITIDDPVRTARQPSPPRGKVSCIVHISNLVRPFTLGQLKELLSRTGTLVEEGFWIDKIKSHCYVTYCSSEEAVATRAALHGVKWPQSNPKVLRVDFCEQDELDFHKGLGTADKPGAEEQGPDSDRGRAAALPSLFLDRDQWAEREREMERREKARAEREWDRDKVREFGKPVDEKEGGPRRSRSRERRRKERGKSKEKKGEKKEKPEEPPAKLLDDLFRKTKAAPCIYWLPLTEEQFVEREAARAERMKEREKRTKEREKQRKEQEEEEEKKREEERKERMKAAGDRSEGEKDRERERDRGRDRERDNDKRRDGYRRPGGSGAGGGRRSRSRSDPRERRR
ncbi:apoptotic chromatin condensation inducer in the nucleus [Takifugu rubripes]|uniref:Apoptotic chromatin condensation inducer in the nucleus n=1 Tax=Takifugu rubripes TaxID=31033 RepID=A0A674PHL4_TAKRU|nr:apoptotic chromatin condensation inducer in the nucleus [Takifugu rubripes]